MLDTLRKLCVPKPPQAVNDTYIALVAAARNPFFYTDLHVPDTLDGRFEVIVLHLFLLQHRLIASTTPPNSSDEAKAQQAFAQFLSEAFFYDMDNCIRELGVADTGVSHRIKKMGKAYHGRLQAYSAGLAEAAALRAALARNLYGTVNEGDVVALHRLATYVERITVHLAKTDSASITSGTFIWPAITAMGI
jgi:cytochrome b pre-mRNA-processing protein 3